MRGVLAGGIVTDTLEAKFASCFPPKHQAYAGGPLQQLAFLMMLLDLTFGLPNCYIALNP